MAASSLPIMCSVCLDDVSENCGRTVVTLKCSDKFHLDCIGSAFNARGIMECPNCQAVENGVWKQFENGSPQQAQDMDQDTSYECDQELAMEPEYPDSPILGLIVQEPSAGHLIVDDVNCNLASTPNFDSQLDDPPAPTGGFGSLDVNYQWNGLPGLVHLPCHSLGIAQSCPFSDQGYISTMCGHTSETGWSILRSSSLMSDPANFFQSFGDPCIYLAGNDFETMLGDPFNFGYENGIAPTSNSGEELPPWNGSSSSIETLDSVIASAGSTKHLAGTSHTLPSIGMADQFHSLAASHGWNVADLVTFSYDDNRDD